MRLSASRIKSLKDCSFKFYCNHVLSIPEDQHPKTAAGTCVHLIFEVLKNPRHYSEYKLITQNPQSVYNSKSVTKLIQKFCKLNNVSEEISQHIDDMIILGLNQDYFSEGCIKSLGPEFDFNITNGKYEIKGFIDDLAVYEGFAKIKDYKSQGKKFSEKEINNNIQAQIYQLAVRKLFNLPSSVEFILLRHPPTQKKPLNHLQTVPAYSEEFFKGLEFYLDYLTDYLKDFDYKKACSSFHKDYGFCKNVCQFRNAFPYFALIDKETKKIIKTSKKTEDLQSLLDEKSVIENRQFFGCPKWVNHLA